ncbi:type I secretion system protein LssZ [Legionella sp.]|uniref:type I secretion system protein LssZ n=1 Tax=Legionella sp. TaxID=459 RepID=UPI003CA37D23
MYTLAKVIQYFFPLIALMLLIIGIHRKIIYYVISSLWLSLIAIFIHFQSSGNQIFGSYFDYANAGIYSFTLLVLLVALIQVISHLTIDSLIFKYLNSFINAFIVVGIFLVITNLWLNAFFIENKKAGTPVMQVALLDKPDYCNYKYVFYKVTPEGSVMYLCPNYYGLIASIGQLSVNPDFITQQLHFSAKK